MKIRPFISLSLLVPVAAVPVHADSPGLFIAHFDHVLGTSFSVKLAAQSWAVARQAERSILAEIDRLNAVLSSYRPDSEFSRWLAAPMGEATVLSDDLFDVLSRFDSWRTQTNGALNAAAEHIGQLWQKAAQSGQKPADTDLLRTVTEVGQIHWQLDANARTATRLTQTPLRLHTFVKSYILDRAAETALNEPGLNGLVLNSGGDILVRGNWQESIAVANPRAYAENAAPLARFFVQNQTVATSGDYRRGTQIGREWVSHIMDPRTGLPAHAIISATVLHPDAVTAGALATAFNVLAPSDSASLAARLPGSEYLLVNRDGQSITSAGWPGVAQPSSEVVPTPTLLTTVHLLSVPAKDKLWNPSQELLITVELARFEGRSHRPFMAAWVEDETGKPVRQLALWYNKPRWLHELREWYNLRIDTGNAASVTSATRSPGEYTLVWDGKDESGQFVKQGKYTVLIEAAREHGSYQLMRQTMDFNGKVKQQPFNGNVEITAAALDYREKSAAH
ncbi:DUF2271 domain-containing protein [Spirosoma flavum]|uniref:FAD:protein FMN transferase n=1 Tax=Spirosoma flavum TaxID=2048557 RepID=A0ABW6AU70_9BACT